MIKPEHGEIIEGDVFDILPKLPENHFHAVVCDPPYGLGFMGRSWDQFDPQEYQDWCEEWASEVQRTLKPGGHLLAFSGSRTHHRLNVGVEEAGFEIRDQLTWIYGSGFPKARDMKKAIQKEEGVEPEDVSDASDHGMWSDDSDYNQVSNQHTMPEATGEAKKWEGWKSNLKPATEFVVLAQNPLSEDTIAQNLLKHGTGALNIDASRIPTEENWEGGEIDSPVEGSLEGFSGLNGEMSGSHSKGRYPSNVVFHEDEAERLDSNNASSNSSQYATNADINGSEWDNDVNEGYTEGRDRSMFVNEGPGDGVRSYGDSGGPSKYFYTSKASKSERTENGKVENDHPTVKPLDLMEWLVKLSTAEDQWILDPFAGSGTTLIAADNHWRNVVGIEQNEEYIEIARERIQNHDIDMEKVKTDDPMEADW